MRAYLSPLVHLQRFFIPILIVLLMWAIWRAIVKKDVAVGLALYLAVVVIVDSFMNTGIYLPGIDKGSIRYSEVCAVFLLARRSPAAHPQPTPWGIYGMVAAYFFLLFISALRSDPMMAGIMEFRSIIIPQIVALVVAKRGLDSPEDYRRFFVALSAMVLFVGVWVFWDVFFDRWILKSDVLDKAIYAHNRKLQRFGGMFLNPNYMGAFVVLVFPALFVWALNEPRLWARACAGGSLLALVFCLVQTQSRGPLAAFAVALMLLVVGPCGGVSRARRIGFMTAFVVLFAVAMPGFIEHASKRFDQIDQEREEGRTRETTWRYTLRIIGDHPIAGIGFGEPQFEEAMREYGFEQEFGVATLDAPHNSYLQAAVYAGIPSVLAFLFANALLVFKAVGAARRGTNLSQTSTIFGFAVGITAFLFVIFPDMQLFTVSVAPIYWVFFALLTSLVIAPVGPAVATVAVTRPTILRRPVVPVRPSSTRPAITWRPASESSQRFTAPSRRRR